MSWKNKILVLVAVLIAIYFGWNQLKQPKTISSSDALIRYGITPFQDSALPVIAHQQGWYKRDGLEVKLIDLGWSDVPLALASHSIDVTIYNVDSFMAASEQLHNGEVDVVFYAPLYVWNGAAIMVHGDRGLKSTGDLAQLSLAERQSRVKSAMEQLRGKRIGITIGTTFEQTVRDALHVAGMDAQNDVNLINARPEDNLAAFLAGDLDAFSGGLTERVQAKRHGAVELVIGPDVSVPALDGIIARRDFAEAHPNEMAKLIDIWFETIQYVKVDTKSRSQGVRDYLSGRASVNYTPEEYSIAWTFQHFPDDRKSAISDFLDPKSIYYWQTIWQKDSNALQSQKKITKSVPESLFWGERTLSIHQ